MKTKPCSLHRLITGSSLLALALGLAFAPRVQAAPTLWTGPMIGFTEAPGSNPLLAVNQDRITSDVWITRGGTQGIFNAETESFYSHFFSPQNTAWAYGTLANYASLSYTDWEHWTGGPPGGPPSTVGQPAVMHLISDDIYLSVEFTFWGVGGGGGFSYQRSTLAVPEPTSCLLLLAGLAIVGVARRR